DIPAEGPGRFWRRVGPQHRAILAAQEVDPTAVLRGRTDEEVRVPVAILVSRQRHVPPEVLALGLCALPYLLAGPGRTRHHDAPHAPVDRSVGRRDDQVGEPIARDVRHRHHPVAEEPLPPLAVPGADQRTARSRPYRRLAVLEYLLLELEAGSGGNVRVAVAVDVERLAEAEPQLTVRDGPGEAARQAPPGSGSGAGRDD